MSYAPVVSLHINQVDGRHVLNALARMATDRPGLRTTPGLRFWKLLGTGRGRTFSLRDADPHTWGLFAVWESVGALRDFESSSPYVRRWARLADEQWTAEMVPTRWKGTWAGRAPFGPEASAPSDAFAGPIAVITRARVRPAHWRSFARAVPPVAAAVNSAPGLRYTVGIGEAPVGLQATFSVWDSAASMTAFAYGHESHREIIRRTSAEGWYAEELFARFAVVSTSGTIGGRPV